MLPANASCCTNHTRVSPPDKQDKSGNPQVSGLKKFPPYKALALYEDGPKGKNRRMQFQGFKRFPIANLQAAIAMPNTKQVIQYQADGGNQGKGSANPKGMGNAPDHLPNHLRVAGDADDPGFK